MKRKMGSIEQSILLEIFILIEDGKELEAVKAYADLYEIHPISNAIQPMRMAYQQFCQSIES